MNRGGFAAVRPAVPGADKIEIPARAWHSERITVYSETARWAGLPSE
jgi:hypothetical protein